MSQFGHTVTLVNRTSKTLACKWNGIDYTLPPGEIPNCPRLVAVAAVMQNKLMGSQNPNNPTHFVSLCGMVGDKKWPVTPLEQSTHTEVIDRSKLAPHVQKVELIDLGGATDWDARETSIDMMNEIIGANG